MLCNVRWVVRSVSLGCLLLGIGGLFAASAHGQSVVPMTNNGFYANNGALGQQGWSGFGYFCQPAGTAVCAPSSNGKYHAFVHDSGEDGGGTNAAWSVTVNEDAPYNSNPVGAVRGIDASDFPIFDRAAFGTNFDPDDYVIDVVYKPLEGHEAPMFDVTIDSHDGFITSDVGGVTKGRRYAEQLRYRFGVEREGFEEEDLNVIEYYNQAPKDADGFATISLGINNGSGGATHIGNGTSFLFDGGNLSDNEKVTGDGIADFNDFENLVPNGAIDLYLQNIYSFPVEGGGTTPNTDRLHMEIKDIRVRPRNPDPSLVARFDERSGIGYRYGNPLRTSTLLSNAPDERGTSASHISDVVTPYDIDGNGSITMFMGIPIETGRFRDIDRVQRFNESGFLDGIVIHSDEIIPSGIDGDDLGAEIGIWQDPIYQTFDGTQATINIRYRTLAPQFSPELARADRVVLWAKDLDGNDTAAGQGLEQYRYDVVLNTDGQFHTASVPMTSFTTRGIGFEGVNDGDTLLTDFNLYYMGISFMENGLTDLEIDWITITLPDTGLAGDYNDDGKVDGLDYAMWRNNLGDPTEADINDNGDGMNGVDEGDFTLWKQQYGQMSPPGSGGLAAVPEPATWALLSLTAAAFGLVRRRK